jgi:asparagine synthase (glutamine-hydrolysing)
MCGIGAILRAGGDAIPDAWLDALDARIAHRGPDGQGRFRDRVELSTPSGRRVIEVALVHRRLTVLDPAGGAQPMVSKRGRSAAEGLLAVVHNGCIYNHRELRRELESKGHRFKTNHSDTEVLLHGHREWGAELQDHLEGMYAYALWDRGAGALYLGRDWFGEKPLYYRLEAGAEGTRLLVAASDAAAVADVAQAAPAGPEDLRLWLARYLRFGRAWGGRALAPGGAIVESVAPSVPPDVIAAPEGGRAIDPQELESLLEQATARRLDADVPLGVFLSGGVDSSLVACFARRHRPDLRTYTVRIPDARYDESAHAEAVAAHLGTWHTTLQVAARPAEDLVALIAQLGQPFGDSSILPTCWVSRAAREHVTVALSGDGGDELFAGYDRYLAADILERHWKLLRRLPRRLLRRSEPRGLLHRLGRLGGMARAWPEWGVLATEALFDGEQVRALMGGDPPPPDHVFPEPGRAAAALRRADVSGYLPDDLLCKVDTAAMSVALEVRAPFLDRDLARAALTAPLDSLTPGRQRKGLLRQIARRYLPPAVVDRPKMGFAVPVGRWFRTDFGGLRGMLLDHLHSTEPFGPVTLDRRAIRRLVDEHMSTVFDHGQRLFALLTLAIWARHRA